MPKSWQTSLTNYRYPVKLSDFVDVAKFPQWFSFPLSVGNRTETLAFEDHFRSHAATALESWYEVVFWKMFSQRGRANIQTKRFIVTVLEKGHQSSRLAELCANFVQAPTPQSFEAFHSYMGYGPASLAVTATFPAFMDPLMFPMVDRRVAKWVHECHVIHNAADPTGPQLIDPGIFDNNRTNLRMNDFDFYRSWIEWCRHNAKKLTMQTETQWRARDVEMAVFHAWGDRKPHPGFHLNPLP
jgi:hypothetical protein